MKKITILLCMLLLLSGTSHAMFKQAFAKTMSGLQHTLACTPNVWLLFKTSFVLNYLQQNSSTVPPHVQEFVYKEMGISPKTTIKKARYYASNSLNNTLYLQQYSKDPSKTELEYVINALHDPTSDEKIYVLEKHLDRIKISLHRNKQQLTSFNTQQKLAAILSIPLLTYYTTKRLFKNIPITSFAIKNVLKVPVGIFLGKLNIATTNAYVRYREQKADYAIPNDSRLLRLTEIELKNLINDNKKQHHTLLHQILFSPNPKLEVRLKHIQDRIATLDNKTK